MLHTLSIRDIVLIEALDLEFRLGLNVLTGETGAGKSILLDALGFALGHKVRRDLVRTGCPKGTVVAEFDLGSDHPVWSLLTELDLPGSTEEGLILRRIAAAEGPSRGFVNDQRVSADVLARIGSLLVEVHGQHDDRGLLSPRAHLPLLDAFGGLEQQTAGVRGAWTERQSSARILLEAREALEKAAADADFLRHSVEELQSLAPEPGEDEALDSERRLIRQAAGLTDEIGKAASGLSIEGAEGLLSDALSRLTHVAEKAEGRLEPAIAAIDRCLAELSESQASVADVLDQLAFDPGRLEDVEERLFAIRGLARKHDVQPGDLGTLATDLAARLAAIDAGAAHITGLETAADAARAAYDADAEALSAARRKISKTLDDAVTEELAPLKMENARFETDIATGDAGPDGIDTVRFTAAINPGAAAGPIDKIASGGELARFLLALKVQLAKRSDGLTMIFDEIDRGVGGATADAVGRRLGRLADSGQVLVVTHSPQVAARGDHHFLISKSSDSGDARTSVGHLDSSLREDEIARMLAGDRITDEARSAARALLDAPADKSA